MKTSYGLYMEFNIQLDENNKPEVVITKKFINPLKAKEKLSRKKPPKQAKATEGETVYR